MSSCTRSYEYEYLFLATPEIYFGNRHFFKPSSAIDYGFGLAPNLHYQLFYAQASYLHYVSVHSKSFYSGIGLTVGTFRLTEWKWNRVGPWFNIPLTLGYQFPIKQERNKFIQIQFTPLQTATISYGFGY